MGVLRARVNGVWVDIEGTGNWVPVGTILAFGGATAPPGFAVCNGNQLSRTTYAELFAAIGTTWGPGDGSTTFNIPSLAGRTLVGAGTGVGLTARTLGQSFGAETVALTAAEMPAHQHDLGNHTHSTGGQSQNHQHSININSGYVSSDHTHTKGSGLVFALGSPGFPLGNGGALQLYVTYGASDGISANHYHYVSGWSDPANVDHTHGTYGPSPNLTSSAGSGGAHNNMQPSAVVNYIIRVS